MADSTIRIKFLIIKYVERTITPKETQTLLAALDLYEVDEIEQWFAEYDFKNRDWNTKAINARECDYNQLKARIHPEYRKPAILSYRLIALCACLILVLTCLFVTWLVQKPSPLTYPCGSVGDRNDISTAKYSCILTLSSGCTVTIDSAYTGHIATEGNVAINKLQSGVVVYTMPDNNPVDRVEMNMMNTITTPRGGQYRVVLPDGTRVRLNAASSISYPVVFSGNSRNVQVTGEAFFEVTALPGISFNAWISNASVTTFSGHFNVDAYAPEARVTLISGDMEMHTPFGKATVKTGDQVLLNRPNNLAVREAGADTNMIVSWKKYKRIYTHTPWPDFMADIGRRYDVDMLNTSAIRPGFFSGDLCYDLPLPQVLAMISNHAIQFRKEGKKIIFVSRS